MTARSSRPVLRGWLHVVAFLAALILGPLLAAHGSGSSQHAVLFVYAFSIAALFGVSSAYHRISWSERGREKMQRLDHTTIFIAIGGTYTAVAGLSLSGGAQLAVLLLVWIGSVVGIAISQLFLHAPKHIVAIPYLIVGWCALTVVPELVRGLGPTGFSLLILGGLSYTAGALVYARRSPDPWPDVFGFHEIFHAFTTVGAGLQFAAIAFYALPRA